MADDYADLFDEPSPGREPFPRHGRPEPRRPPAVEGVPPTAEEVAELPKPTSRVAAIGMGLLQGLSFGQGRDIVRVGKGNDPLTEPADPRRMTVEEFRARERVGKERSDRKFDQAELDRPGEFIGAELAGAVMAPGPKVGSAAKGASVLERGARVAGRAGVAAGEGAVYAEGTGGDEKKGAGAGFLASLAASGLGKVAKRIGARLLGKAEQKATNEAAVQTTQQAADEAQKAAATARLAADATAGSKVGKDMRKRAAFADKNAREAVKAAKAAAKAAAPPKERPALEAVVAGALGVGGATAVSLPAIVADPSKATSEIPKIGLGLAAAALPKIGRKGRQVAESAATRVAARAAKVSPATTAAAGQVGAGARRVASGAASEVQPAQDKKPTTQDDYGDLF